MPIYEYLCKACEHQFETLVLGGTVPVCASCGGTELERLLSLPNVKSETTRAQAMRAAQRRDKAQGTERTQEQIRYEKSHND
jgi:putative FmdB family regulatory protein